MNKIVIRYFLMSSLFIATLQLSATTYYIDFSWGNDFLSGTTITAPWKTINKINNSNFQPGDSILFKRGESWKEYLNFPSSGNAFNSVVVGSYGEGAFPIITGVNVYEGWDNPINWNSVGNNIWSREQSDNPQRMWINGEEVLRNIEIDSLDGTRYHWAWENSTLYVYSGAIPATTFNLMEVNIFYQTVRVGNKNYITIQDIEIQGGTAYGLAIRGCSNIIVKNCRIGTYSRQGIQIRDNLGVSSSYVIIENCVIDSKFNFSYGATKGIDDGILITTGANNCIIRNNTIKDFGHTGIYLISVNASDNGVYDNKIFGNDISGENVTYMRGIATDGYENKCRDNEFFNNIIRNTTVRNQINGNNNWIHHNVIYGMKNSPAKSYATAQGFDLQGYGTNQVCHHNKIDNNLIMNCDEPGIYFRGNGNPKNNNFIRNNIILNCGKNSIAGYDKIGITIENHNSILTNYFYNNCIYNGDETSNVVSLRGVKINVSDFNSQVSTYDIASNNIQKNPLIETSDSSNFFLTENSLCIDGGKDVGLTFDYYGNEIYFGEAPDIGIHEYSSPTDIFSEKSNVTINFLLKQNYPNPFNPTTTINYSIPIESYVKLIIYDILGNEISTLIDEHQKAGKYTVKFNAQNMASGIYFYNLDTQKHSLTKKMILLR